MAALPTLASIAAHWHKTWGVSVPDRACWVCSFDPPDDGMGNAGGLTRAHIVAVRNGGTTRLNNLMICCPGCNYHLDKTVEAVGRTSAVAWVRRCRDAPEMPPHLSRAVAKAFLTPVAHLDPKSRAIRSAIQNLVGALVSL